MGGRESGGIFEVTDWSKMPTNRKPGKPNSRYDYKPRSHKGNKGPNGEKSSRWTGPDGRPSADKDYDHHGTDTHEFPHGHAWENGERGPAVPWGDFNGIHGYER